MQQIIECVPNFSEGRDLELIRRITDAAAHVDGVALLDVDPGKATNRTVVTFAGEPEAVVEAAVQAARVAAELIDMRQHRGEHPRFGALDVCPLVPVSGITMDETVEWARKLAQRLGDEVGLTVFCYENAALSKSRRNLATVRAGEYEGLEKKLAGSDWRPDFGPAEFNPRSGATAVSARDFLVAYNINLNTTSARRANAIAFDVRERGRVKRKGDPLTGEIVRDENGKPVYSPGSLEAVKAIGWYIEEYGIAQISMNLTDIEVTPVHVAFDEVRRSARARGIRVTGSELVGLMPLRTMLEAGRFYLEKQQRSAGIPDREIIKIAIKSLGLDDLKPFDPAQKIIEYRLGALLPEGPKLVRRTVVGFTEETASESPAPGGGSVAAAVGALGAALGTMVANLSAHKRGWDERWQEFSDCAARGKEIYEALLELVDRDTEAFNALITAQRLPKGSESERKHRDQAVQEAARRAMEIPLEVMEKSLESMSLLMAMAESGNPASVSDAGVGALCARAAVRGAYLNVEINSSGLEDQKLAADLIARGKSFEEQAEKLECEILAVVADKL
ncbi:MAG: glutamate formimidoyltransferase [Acidobacteria bacterium]|nr:glutamate formimidoyltransferase [Acidobacteriota bacterium]